MPALFFARLPSRSAPCPKISAQRRPSRGVFSYFSLDLADAGYSFVLLPAALANLVFTFLRPVLLGSGLILQDPPCACSYPRRSWILKPLGMVLPHFVEMKFPARGFTVCQSTRPSAWRGILPSWTMRAGCRSGKSFLLEGVVFWAAALVGWRGSPAPLLASWDGECCCSAAKGKYPTGGFLVCGPGVQCRSFCEICAAPLLPPLRPVSRSEACICSPT